VASIDLLVFLPQFDPWTRSAKQGDDELYLNDESNHHDNRRDCPALPPDESEWPHREIHERHQDAAFTYGYVEIKALTIHGNVIPQF
jgi:hypothetical protein